MTHRCGHFRVITLRSAPHPRERPVIAITGDVPWCDHPDSPVTETCARDAVGGQFALHCRGDTRRCPIVSKLKTGLPAPRPAPQPLQPGAA